MCVEILRAIKPHVTNWSGHSHKMRARYGVFICALRVFRHISVNEFLAFELHVGHRSVVFICHSVVEHFNCMWLLYSVTADRMGENCLCRHRTEEHQTKQLHMAQWTAYHRRIPKLSRRLVYGGPSVACCVTTVQCLWTLASCRNTVEGCWLP